MGGDVYLERALVNPVGADPGLEVVVLGNLSTAPAPLDGWTLRDKNGLVTSLTGVTIAAGASALVTLDGRGVQLGNKGGNLVLGDATGAQVDAGVYSATEATAEGRFLRFHR